MAWKNQTNQVCWWRCEMHGPGCKSGFGSLVLAGNYRGEMELDNILHMCLLLLYKGALKTKDVWDISFLLMHDYGGRKSVHKQLVKFLTSFLCLGLAALFTKTLEKPLVLLPLHDTMARASVDRKDDTLSHEQHAAVNYCCSAAQPRGVITWKIQLFFVSTCHAAQRTICQPAHWVTVGVSEAMRLYSRTWRLWIETALTFNAVHFPHWTFSHILIKRWN